MKHMAIYAVTLLAVLFSVKATAQDTINPETLRQNISNASAIAESAMNVMPSTQSFGRLFTSVQERRALDNLRRNIQPETSDTPRPLPSVPMETVLQVPTEVQFSGFVKRADGRYAIWINGVSSLSSTNQPIDQARFSSEVPYAILQTNQQQATMKPGQIWSLDSNTVREGYYVDREVQKAP